jgi:hypothetical protein
LLATFGVKLGESQSRTLLSFVVELFVGTFLCGATLHILQQRTALDRKATVGEALAFAWHKWGAVIGGSIAASIQIVIGLLLLIVPGIARLVRYSLVEEVAVLEPEKLGSKRLLSRTGELTDGHGVLVAGSFVMSWTVCIAALFAWSFAVALLVGDGETVVGTALDDIISDVIFGLNRVTGFVLYCALAGALEPSADPIADPIAEPAIAERTP